MTWPPWISETPETEQAGRCSMCGLLRTGGPGACACTTTTRSCPCCAGTGKVTWPPSADRNPICPTALDRFDARPAERRRLVAYLQQVAFGRVAHERQALRNRGLPRNTPWDGPGIDSQEE